jgi:hypothetical protein
MQKLPVTTLITEKPARNNIRYVEPIEPNLLVNSVGCSVSAAALGRFHFASLGLRPI